MLLASLVVSLKLVLLSYSSTVLFAAIVAAAALLLFGVLANVLLVLVLLVPLLEMLNSVFFIAIVRAAPKMHREKRLVVCSRGGAGEGGKHDIMCESGIMVGYFSQNTGQVPSKRRTYSYSTKPRPHILVSRNH